MADPRVDSRPNIVIDPRTIELIERVVYDEAAGEGVEGRNAVRAVIYNRIATNRRDFGGNTALGVLNAPKQFQGVMEKGGGDARNLTLPENTREQYLKEHVDFLQRGEDPTNGATFFQNPQAAKNPYKANGGQRIGRHVFYDNYAGNKVEVPDFKVSLKGVRPPPPKATQVAEENPLEALPEEPQSPFQGMASTTPQVEEENPLVALEEPTTTPFSPLAGNQQAVPDKLAFGSPMDDIPKFAQGGLVLRLADLEDEEDEDEEDILKPLEEEEDDEDDEEDMLPKPQEDDDEDELELSKGGVINKEPAMAKKAMKMFQGGFMDDEYDDEVEFTRGKEELEDEEDDAPKKPKGMSDKEYSQVLKLLKTDNSAGSGIGGAIANAGKQIAAYLMKPEDTASGVAQAYPIEMYKGGMMAPEVEITVEEVSGNPVPPGSLPEEVADDVPVMMSEGEVVLPADVVRWHGLKHIMEMRAEAKHGLMCMFAEGQIQVPGEDEESEDEEYEEEDDSEEEYEGEEIEDKKQLKVLEDIVGDEELIILFRKDGSIFKN